MAQGVVGHRVTIEDPPIAQMLFADTRLAWFWLIIRVYTGYEWLWRVSRSLVAPLYMCTPHGRHGSKLRTARMMSIPLNLSGPFSSKMGVFCTESSYGPGVP